MDALFKNICFAGGIIALFFICLALIGIESTRNLGIGVMLLEGGGLSLLASIKISSPVEYILGGLGAGAILAAFFFLAEAMKLFT